MINFLVIVFTKLKIQQKLKGILLTIFNCRFVIIDKLSLNKLNGQWWFSCGDLIFIKICSFFKIIPQSWISAPFSKICLISFLLNKTDQFLTLRTLKTRIFWAIWPTKELYPSFESPKYWKFSLVLKVGVVISWKRSAYSYLNNFFPDFKSSISKLLNA